MGWVVHDATDTVSGVAAFAPAVIIGFAVKPATQGIHDAKLPVGAP
jgi:hypothetical protein